MSNFSFDSDKEDHVIKLMFGDSSIAFNPKDIDAIHLDDKKVKSIRIETTNIEVEKVVEIDKLFKLRPNGYKFLENPTFETAIDAYYNSLNKLKQNNGGEAIFIASYFYLYMLNENQHFDSDKVRLFYSKHKEFCTNNKPLDEQSRRSNFFNMIQEVIRVLSPEWICYDIDILSLLFDFINNIKNEASRYELTKHFVYDAFNLFVNCWLNSTYIVSGDKWYDKVVALRDMFENENGVQFRGYKSYCIKSLETITLPYELKSTLIEIIDECITNENEKNRLKEKMNTLGR